MIRVLASILAGFALIAATDPPERPAQLEPYFEGEHYDPGEFAWLKGAFGEASPEEKATFEKINLWLEQCWETGRQTALAQLAERGVVVDDPQRLLLGAIDCSLVSSRPDTGKYSDYDAMVAALRQTRPIFDALRSSAELTNLLITDKDDALAAQLEKRTVQEQILRNSFSWVWSNQPGFPQLGQNQKAIFSALLSGETMRVDHANTQWLKAVVEEKGWPTVSMVGEKASRKAWLLVQHADQDPVFQLDTLRMMEPLVDQGEVSPRDYAYLYDRVMLKLTGKQRYATQMWCQDGKMEPQPLEDEATVAELRTKMTLDPLEEYRKNFPETCG